MKIKINYLLFAVTGIILICSVTLGLAQHKPKDLTLAIMSFNIRMNYQDDGPNNWPNRRDWMGDLIHYYQPGLLGTQETYYPQYVDLKERLPDYGSCGPVEGRQGAESTAIFYLKENYELIRSGTFWLSETPEKQSIGWDAALRRTVTWGEFKIKANNNKIFFFNTHFDHKGPIAREESSKLLLKKVHEIAGNATAFVTGDFNSRQEGPYYKILTTGTDEFKPLFDTYKLAKKLYGPSWTLQDFGKMPVEKRPKIDYIFSNKKVDVITYVNISEQRGEIYPSDHNAQMATMSIASFCAEKANSVTKVESELITPRPKPQPRINGPLVYGCRPGNPFLYRIPCQGERPIRFLVKGMPPELKLDPSTGIITGKAPQRGEYDVLIQARNSKGKDKRKLKIVAGDQLALTPPMGWNHWYAHYDLITDQMMREAADIMISSGLADVGYQYVNIDDCWMNAPKNKDSMRVGPLRDEQGNIIPNRHFPDMKGLSDYIHSKGLKAGIYTSPGPLTCAGFAGAYQHEEQDARQFAAWGFDFLKYDWCSYGKVPENDKSIEAYQKPYRQMGNILKSLDRDIVFNICQYGMGDVWKWGGEVGGNCWRTSGDLGYKLDRIFEVALRNSEFRQYSKPGQWNDPDYIQIGWIGRAGKMRIPGFIPMPAAMQYAYMSLWSLMAAPLIYSGDMTKLDEFTLNVLCNPEVIEVNQDPLGECGLVIRQTDDRFLMVKNLADGSKAVGLFNRGESTAEVVVDWAELQISGKQSVRNLWRQKELGVYKQKFSAQVPAQGVVMVKISKR